MKRIDSNKFVIIPDNASEEIEAEIMRYASEDHTARKGDYKIYHKSYSDAISEVLDFIDREGFEVDPEEVFDKISTGPKKPNVGETVSIKLDLTKDGQPSRRMAVFQVYGMPSGKSYELNLYLS